MRTLLLAVLWLTLQEPDLESEVSRLVERLSDDRNAVRNEARRSLLALGPRAKPLIRRRAETADLEAREGLLAILRDIERAERLTSFLPEPRRIRLHAERRPIGEVVKELARQSGTPVVLKDVPPEEPVTVDLRDRPFFDALQELCKAHGTVVFRLPEETYTLEDHSPVVILRGDPKARRTFISGPFAIQVDSVYNSERVGDVGKAAPSCGLMLHVGWERGVRPTQMKLQVTSIVDETGAAVKLADVSLGERSDVYFWRRQWAMLAAVPPPAVTIFREISGTLEFEFPTDGHWARVERPMERKNVEAAGGPASFTLEEMVRVGPDQVHAVVEIGTSAADSRLDRIRFFAIDELDRIYPQQGARERAASSGLIRSTVSFELPEGTPVKELRAVKLTIDQDRPVGRKVAWKLENVRFR
ncbi:MAG: hypothetical protein EHM91_06315 [Planctomycetota bacterium]|nr:MAG: hypothetical protein EHM91_06315 [Planctomycetota bacterium]